VSTFSLLLLPQIRKLYVRLDGFETDGAAEPMRIVVCALMLAKVLSSVESLGTCFCRARERLGTKVHSNDMSLQGILLPEGLVAISEPSTSISFVTYVSSQMVSQPSTGDEALATAFPGAFVVADFGVGTFDVVLQVAVSQIRIGTSWVRALASSVISVSSKVFFESRRPVESFRAVLMFASKPLLLVAGDVLLVRA
jgi:hypothetical protein